MPVPYPGQMVGAVPDPGQSQYPPSFSYGLPQGYGQQQNAAAWGASAVGNIPGAIAGIGSAAGFAAMFTHNPVVHAAQYLDPMVGATNVGGAAFASRLPLTMGARGFAVAGTGVEGVAARYTMASISEGFAAKSTALWAERAMLPEAIGAGAVGMAGPLALGAALYGGARYAGQQFMGGAREQMVLGQQLGGAYFANGMAPTGRGFSFAQQGQIGQAQRRMDAGDSFTTMGDIAQLTDQFMGAGMSRGIESAKEFSKKLKEFVGNVKNIATELGTTLEEAGRIKLQMKHTGFYTAADVLGNTRQMQVAKGQGMEEGTFLGMQARGAAMTRGAEMSGRAGSKTSARFAQQLMYGASSGKGLSDTRLMDFTGAETGAEAAAEAGLELAARMTNFLTNTAGGNAVLAVSGEQNEHGEYTGEAGTGRLSGVRLDQLAGRGRSRMQTMAQRGSFMANKNEIASSLMESDQGIAAVLTSIGDAGVQRFGGSMDEDTARKLMYEKVLGADKRQAEEFLSIVKNAAEARTKAAKDLRGQRMASDLQLDMARNYTLGGIMTQVGGGLHDTLGAPIGQVGANFATGVQQMQQNALDMVMGVSRGQVDDSSRAASLNRLSSGAASGVTTSAGVRDFSYGSAARAVAQRTGATAALAMKETALADGETSLASLGYDVKENHELNSFLASANGKEAQSLLARARSASPEDAARLQERARALVQGGLGGSSFSGSGGGAAYNIGKVGSETNRALAAVMLKAGDTKGANAVLRGGSTTSHAYHDVKKAREEATNKLTGLGVSSELATQLATGGAGSALFVSLGGAKGGMEAFEATMMNADGTSNDAKTRAEMLSKSQNMAVSEEDVLALTKANSQVLAQSRQWNTVGDKFDKRTRVRTAEEASRLWSDAAQSAAVSVDTGMIDAFKSAKTALGQANEETRAALGSSYTTAMESLNKGEMTADEYQVAIRNLDAMVVAAGATGAGGEYGEMGQRRKKALAAIHKGTTEGIKGLEDVYGKDFADAFIGDKTKVTQADLEGVLARTAGSDALNVISSGAGGGINRRGLSVEERINFDLNLTSTQVQKTAEAISGMNDKLAASHIAGFTSPVAKDGHQ